MPPEIEEDILHRMVRGVEEVRERLHRASSALECAQIPYAVADENAVAYWVAQVDDAAVRYTPEVEILLRRSDLDAAKSAFVKVGLVYRKFDGVNLFLEAPNAKIRDAVRIILAGEGERSDDHLPAPDVDESESTTSFRVVALESLVRMKLTSYRAKDRMNLLDMIYVGILDDTWLPRLPPALSQRLKALLDNPEGS